MQIARIGNGSAEQCPAEIVGGKAANLARMAALGLPVPPAFVLPISLCAATVNGEAAAVQDLADGSDRRNPVSRKRHRQAVRRPAPPASGVGAFGRRALDAGNAGHGARCRLHVRGRSRPRAHDRSSAFCKRLPAPLSRKLRRRGARHRSSRICEASATSSSPPRVSAANAPSIAMRSSVWRRPTSKSSKTKTMC